ncbi:MAG TPA: glutamine--tRNA ligase/YqeY domain fusion protein [Candidatus Udaeobacter sp.]|jgi:glutaminyl-tRNA synthetase|nr:glutamine--tRNA ligase/YqeY domain fusion protein [Candidatus Udaeobacter sp.]
MGRSTRKLSICAFADILLVPMTTETERPSDFIRDIIAEDLRTGKYKQIITRFPPEPNGYLHIGHAKSICLNFGIAREFGGICNIRMDDTNPTKEEAEYVRSIMADVHWLIDGWADKQLGGEPFYASDYFDRFYEYAVELIRKGKAYVDDMSPEETDAYRRLGKASSFRDRSVDDNLDLFARMKAGEFADGARTLRAKIDVNAANVWLRDPVFYRIRHATHHRTGDNWCIYPMYDWAHTLSDYIEGITHSICTLEFEVHRPLYDWILDALEIPEPRPHQHEFARFNLTYTVMSKRKLIQLVDEKLVHGWDDPRMLTISGLRRRGVTPTVLRSLAYNVGITKYPSMTDMALLEHTVRDEFNRTATRRLVVLRPIKVVLINYPEGKTEELDATNNPEDPNAGTRKIPFGRELYIERDDFMESPPPKYFRLRPGGEVRLKYAYIIKCEEVMKDDAGNVTELRCSVDLDSKSGGPTAGRKVKGTIHWVSASHAVDADVRLYDRLFTVPEPDSASAESSGETGAPRDFKSFINSNSLEVANAKCEPTLANARPEERYQFERLGYFTLDSDSAPQKQIWNRTATLRDTWAKTATK